MSGTNGHRAGSPRDGGIARILVEIRDLRRGSAEAWDRYATEAAADRRQAAEDRREAEADRKAIVDLLGHLGEIATTQQRTLARIEANQHVHTRALLDIARALRSPRNGRGGGGNGKHRR